MTFGILWHFRNQNFHVIITVMHSMAGHSAVNQYIGNEHAINSMSGHIIADRNSAIGELSISH